MNSFRTTGSARLPTVDSYLSRTILAKTAVALLGLLGLVAVFAFIEETGERGADYGLSEMAWFIMLTLPRRCLEVLPYALLLGSLLGLGGLAGNSELTVLRASGCSPWRLLRAVSWAATGVCLLGLAGQQWAGPASEAAAERYKARLTGKPGRLASATGYWHKADDLYTQISAISDSGELRRLHQYQWSAEGGLQRWREAERAVFQPARAQQPSHWILYNGSETVRQANALVSEPFSERVWHSLTTPDVFRQTLMTDPRRLSFSALHRQIDVLKSAGEDATGSRVAFWTKALQPAAIFGLAALALGVVLGPMRQTSIGARLAAGVAIGLGLKYLQDLFTPMAMVFGMAPQVSAAAPILLCWGFAIWQLRRQH